MSNLKGSVVGMETILYVIVVPGTQDHVTMQMYHQYK
jgi:hypothetical protein